VEGPLPLSAKSLSLPQKSQRSYMYIAKVAELLLLRKSYSSCCCDGAAAAQRRCSAAAVTLQRVVAPGPSHFLTP